MIPVINSLSRSFTNAVQHASKDDDGEVVVGFGLYGDRLEVMVADHGESFNFTEIKKAVGPDSVILLEQIRTIDKQRLTCLRVVRTPTFEGKWGGN